MARRVHQVQLISLAVISGIVEPDRLGLDGNATFPLDIHRVEHLRLHVAVGKAAAILDQTIRQGRLTVVDMGDDGEVSDMR